MPSLVEKQRPFTVDEYHAMARAGILTEDDRVELIDGHILAMSPIGDLHVACVNRLTYLFGVRLYTRNEPPAVIISVQNPVRLGLRMEPQPDVVLRRSAHGASGIPKPDDVLLLIEVAETSLDYDREVKVPRYAAAGIPEVWIVALEEGHVEVYRNPGSRGYAAHARFEAGEHLTVDALPELGSVTVDDVLGVRGST